jgi:hypothetical protein
MALNNGPTKIEVPMPHGGIVIKYFWTETAKKFNVNPIKLRQYAAGNFLTDLE